MDLLIRFCEEGTEGRLLKITENKQYFVIKTVTLICSVIVDGQLKALNIKTLKSS